MCEISSECEPLKFLKTDEIITFAEAAKCQQCDTYFTSLSRKVRHHCHLTGKLLTVPRNNCNMQIQFTKGRGLKRKAV